MEVLHLPIPDGGLPVDPEANRYEAFVKNIADHLEKGRTVVVHCRGGLGRSGMVAASVLVALGRTAEEALQMVRSTRKGAVETPEQDDRVRWFALELRAEGG